MRNAGLEEAQAGIKIAEKNINNLRYAYDTTLMAESEKELKSLLINVKKRVKNKGERKRYTQLNAEFQRIARKDKIAFLSDQCKEIKETIEWERLEISSRQLDIPREYFMQRWAG